MCNDHTHSIFRPFWVKFNIKVLNIAQYKGTELFLFTWYISKNKMMTRTSWDSQCNKMLTTCAFSFTLYNMYMMRINFMSVVFPMKYDNDICSMTFIASGSSASAYLEQIWPERKIWRYWQDGRQEKHLSSANLCQGQRHTYLHMHIIYVILLSFMKVWELVIWKELGAHNVLFWVSWKGL